MRALFCLHEFWICFYFLRRKRFKQNFMGNLRDCKFTPINNAIIIKAKLDWRHYYSNFMETTSLKRNRDSWSSRNFADLATSVFITLWFFKIKAYKLLIMSRHKHKIVTFIFICEIKKLLPRVIVVMAFDIGQPREMYMVIWVIK